MKEAPTRNGIAISPYELWLPDSRDKKENIHHGHYYAKMFGRTAVHQALRDLDRHQHRMKLDVHAWWHRTYGPGQFPTEEQAALEVVDAYDRGEHFSKRGGGLPGYHLEEIPLSLVDGFIAKYGLSRYMLDMAGD